MGLRRILLGLSAVATVILGLEKVGVYQFVPGADLRFQGQTLSDGARVGLSLRNDAGDLTCWIRVVVRAGGNGQPSFSATNWSGDPLTIVPHALGANLHELTISKQAAPPDGVPFLWRAGLPLEIETSPAVPLTLEDWVVFPNNQPSDTRAKDNRRWWWTRLSWGFLALSVLGTLLTALKEKEERETVTTLTLVRTIEGRDPQETKRVRAFLTKVLLEDTPVREALTSARLPAQSTAAKFVFLTQATSLFRERIRVIQEELDGYTRLLLP
jgi:hypothetical protein